MVTKRSRRAAAMDSGSDDDVATSADGKPSLSLPKDEVASAQAEDSGFPKDAVGVRPDKIVRDTPEVSLARKALIDKWCGEIRLDKTHWKKDFKRMRDDMMLNRLGADRAWVEAEKYVVPIINRKINTDVAALYAKNPKIQAKRRERMNFKLWDGTQQSATAAYQAMEAGDPTGKAIVQEILQFQQSSIMLNRLGKTMEILFNYFTSISTPTFKKSMKKLVRRTKTCGVGYIELGFQRLLEPDPTITDKIDDVTNQIALIESKMADVKDGILKEGDSELEQLRFNLQELKDKEMLIVREGPVFSFPKSTKVIPHRACYDLAGFQGADYVAIEFTMTPDEVQATYKVDIGKNFTPYTYSVASTLGADEADPNENRKVVKEDAGPRHNESPKDSAVLWRVLDKKNRQVFTICEGYPDFLREPEENPVKVNGFWSIFSVTFNDIEDENEIYPMSDVHYMKHPQKEFNTARQGKREHRKANRPKYFAKKGALEDDEKERLESHEANAIIEVKGMDAKTPVDALVVGFKSVPIDPNLYSTTEIMQDVLYGVGSQSADLGNTNTASATQSSISEESRMSTLGSNIDDLDTLLSEVADATGQVMLAELSVATVQEICGPGAVWPLLNRDEISKELMLDVKAGSSGKPNVAASLANMERGMPYLIQMGGINPATLGKKYGDLLDLDMEDLEAEGMPSIIALNAIAIEQARAAAQAANNPQGAPTPGGAPSGPAGQAPVPTGQPTSPEAQGPQGTHNIGSPGNKQNENEPGPQPAYHTVARYDQHGGRIR